ncbi:hypothetical protein EBQ26_04660 [Allofranklinella schreckenbergeri]|uniref:Uncharacterized protein n=1 Tax=Allofranklinella schreckenbergeri TaxID=1076744 RepID=A0A3M6Q8Y2_9BURK|nr:hypothetical protein [Allofranklinella schreckenbergeri]RMW99637.1 hypothetical protein EBQ26_04660 [Allofranklinella schreckenbergeri]RRD44687.1 hypothetical protein EII18_00700 [Comamonadaceae bacterium OH3737_COT-264]
MPTASPLPHTIGLALAGLAWVLAAAPAAAQTQPALEQADIIELLEMPQIDTPLMQLPIEQGTRALTGRTSAAGKRQQQPDPALASLNATRTLCDAALEAMAASRVEHAFAALAPHWPLPPQEITRLAKETAAQFKQLNKTYGATLGYEWVHTHSAGASLVQHAYLLKLERHALRVSCIFYKPREQWQIHTVFWDDQLQTLLEH